jgi:histidine phosphotransfer protein HptB
MPNDVLIDAEAIENLRALNPDDGDAFLRDIVGIYLEDTPQRIAELHSSLAANDQPTFTRAAHSIKGSSSNIGATQVRAVSEKLEHESRKQGLAGLTQLITELEAAFDLTRAELERIIGATKG